MTDENPTSGGNNAGSGGDKVGYKNPPKDTQFGGPRAPRRGKRVPKDNKALMKAIDKVGAEMVKSPLTGEEVQRFYAMLRSMMTGKDSRGKVEILNRRYGKVKEEIDVNVRSYDVKLEDDN
jgi:hypothetical protein